jgi:hypothetical protein
LIDLQFYTVNLGDLQLVGNGESDLEEPGLPLEPRCIVRELKVRAADKPGMYKVSADVRSPLQYLAKPRETTEHQIKAWTAACDCPDDQTEVKGQCFGRRFAASILTKLRQISGNEKKNLSAESIERIVRGVGRPYIPYDRLLIEERGLVGEPSKDGSYLMQSLKPGDDICFSTANYSLGWAKTDFDAIAEPAAHACFPWLTLIQNSQLGMLQGDVGIDPLKPFRPSPKPTKQSPLMVTPDQITPKGPWLSAILFSDWTMMSNSPSKPKDEENQTRSFLLLARDQSLLNWVRVQLKTNKDISISAKNARDQMEKWKKNNKQNNEPESPLIKLPGNIRPFVSFWLEVNNSRERVRVGMSLLNLIDQRLSLSGQVLPLRTRENHQELATTLSPSKLEREKIQAIIPKLTYRRRTGIQLQTINLSSASRLEDFLIPLNSGDQIQWH